MTVICKLVNCPYYQNGFCNKKLVSIDENGHCNQIWKKGMQRPDCFNNVDEQYKDRIIIEDN